MLTTIQNAIETKDGTDLIGEFFDMYFLDPAGVRAKLNQAWSFSAAWWKDRDPYLRYDQLLYICCCFRHRCPSFRANVPSSE